MFKKTQIHLINPFGDITGGSEWRALVLYKKLLEYGGCNVSLWSEYEPDKELSTNFPIKKIIPKLGRFPKRGIFVFFGAYFHIGRWIKFTSPNRIILIYNTFNPDFLHERLKTLSKKTEVELVYSSELIKASAALPGRVELSPIDLNDFKPVRTSPKESFNIGRLSRDHPSKHHSDNNELYIKLANNGCKVDIMGGTCLKEQVQHPNISLLPGAKIKASTFIQGLDVFLYRTSPKFTEPHGRVITEAMACGIPVVCEDRGGYTEFIVHGESGFLFKTNQEAFSIIMELKSNPDLRKKIGNSAQICIEERFKKQELSLLKFYTSITS